MTKSNQVKCSITYTYHQVQLPSLSEYSQLHTYHNPPKNKRRKKKKLELPPPFCCLEAQIHHNSPLMKQPISHTLTETKRILIIRYLSNRFTKNFAPRHCPTSINYSSAITSSETTTMSQSKLVELYEPSKSILLHLYSKSSRELNQQVHLSHRKLK